MEVVTLKRQRDEEEKVTEESFKRQKSYEDILSILDEDEEEPTQDLSSLITTLQQEISSNTVESLQNDQTQMSNSCSETEQDESERMMKHLLEASDDELGIPNTEAADFGGSQAVVTVEEMDAGDLMLFPAVEGGFGDGLLWEIEDEAANYYALLQSELFM